MQRRQDDSTDGTQLRVLFVEDQSFEAELAERVLAKSGLRCRTLRVETEEDLRSALDEFSPQLVLSDFSLPRFDGLSALRICRTEAPEVPFIFLSGTIGEERAIEALRSGAVDYVLKGNLARLVPAVDRALTDAVAREEGRRQRGLIERLNRVMSMVSGINALVVRVRDEGDLLNEACRLAVSTGGYASAIAVMTDAGHAFRLAATATSMPAAADALAQAGDALVQGDRSVLQKALATGEPIVWNGALPPDGDSAFESALAAAGFASFIALPFIVDRTSVGVWVLAARATNAISEEECMMLRDVAGNLSFGLQYLHADTSIRRLAHFDGQTGLARRGLFCERLQRSLGRASDSGEELAVAVLDVEDLTVINDSFGRRTGDLLLQHIADRLKQHFPDTTNLAHLSGGTFAVAGAAKGPGSLESLLGPVFEEPFTIEDHLIPISMRAGLVLFPDDGAEAEALLQNAESALRNARSSQQRHLHYSEQKNRQGLSRLALLHRLRLALPAQQFMLHYQPKVNIATRRIEGVEALLRWNDPENGVVAPAGFLPLLESSGLIVDVGRWVIEQAARDCQAWRELGLPAVRIAVNVAPVQLNYGGFEQHFLDSVRPWASAEWGLDIEITEGMLHEDAGSGIRKLELLRSIGTRIAVDDFGTGYSSLSRLATLPVDTLKIDRGFITSIATDPAQAMVVKTIVALGRAFDMTTVAEGVERKEQFEILRQMGCHQSQGYLHSRPVPNDSVVELMAMNDLQSIGGL